MKKVICVSLIVFLLATFAACSPKIEPLPDEPEGITQSTPEDMTEVVTFFWERIAQIYDLTDETYIDSQTTITHPESQLKYASMPDYTAIAAALFTEDGLLQLECATINEIPLIYINETGEANRVVLNRPVRNYIFSTTIEYPAESKTIKTFVVAYQIEDEGKEASATGYTDLTLQFQNGRWRVAYCEFPGVGYKYAEE